ncbi:MAG: asparagine synthase (glutamine-hydrolyzing) [Actinomycetota bacterium]|nr:asparagine synthase (glutamine-hydrolyzing) [Actinomycetota bacterium]
MCGISGLLVADNMRDAVVDEQLHLLQHRGPDASGAYVRGHAVVAQNRLAIIDLVDGDPPIHTEDGSIGVALNGEIYNYRQLREQLSRDGHVFASHGDTEVIAHLAEEHEPAALASRLDGMFAFAVWDERRQRLVLGRDRVGKKPLYYWACGGELVFGSELKAVLAHPRVPRRLEPRAIPAHLMLGYVPTPLTFFEGVVSLPPGHVLVAEPGKPPVIEQYWRPQVPGADPVERLDVSLPEAASLVREQLTRAVERRLISDVSLGAFLSGGIDSSAIVGIMAGLSDHPVPTFTIGFDDRDGFDERPYARAVAARHGTDHHEEVVTPNAVDLVERLVWHHDQPFGDSSAIPTFLLAEMTRRNVTVALSGDGGDELFAGYERFAAALAVDRYHVAPRPMRLAARRLLDRLPPTAMRGRIGNAQRFAEAAEAGLPGAYRAWISFIPDDVRRALLGHDDRWVGEDFDRRWRAADGADLLDRVLRINVETYLLDDLLVKADRMSMAHALEVRSPFLDKDLLELALRLPPSTKARGLSLKRVLKAAVADLLPDEILSRRKRGFGVPLDRWFREDLGSYVRSTVGAPDARVRQHLVGSEVDRLLHEHATGERNHGHALWVLLTLEVFLRQQGW